MSEPTRHMPPAAAEKPAADKKVTKNLEIRDDDAAKIKGGARRVSSDPCEGGE